MIIVDSHIHVRRVFDLTQFFDQAMANMNEAAAQIGHSGAFAGVLMLTESREDWPFAKLAGMDGTPRPAVQGTREGGWSFHRVPESCSLRVSRGDSSLIMIAGKQIKTIEGLEIHHLGTERSFPDRTPIAQALEAGDALGVEQVIPWAPGKWIGRRALLSRIMTSRAPRRVHLADLGTRPFWWPTPPPFLEARAIGHHVLRGSDPGPFLSELRRTGNFGFTIDAELDPDRPAAALGRLLRDPGVRLDPYGKGMPTWRFARIEILKALTRKARARASAPVE